MPVLHLRVLYGWHGENEGVGDIFHVRMRVPEDDPTPLQDLVTKDEVLGRTQSYPGPKDPARSWREAGGCCCDATAR
eukprot:gene6472-135_t